MLQRTVTLHRVMPPFHYYSLYKTYDIFLCATNRSKRFTVVQHPGCPKVRQDVHVTGRTEKNTILYIRVEQERN